MSKVELIKTGGGEDVLKPDGAPVTTKDAMIYLGALLHQDGRIEAELCRRLGMATGDFHQLQKVWRHTNLSHKDNYRVYEACVLSRLLYGLQAAWLLKDARRRLDGFHAKCVRQILGIAPSYYSRVSNETVLKEMGAEQLSKTLHQRQLDYFGELARRPAACPVRCLIFNEDLSAKESSANRRRGRPRLTWSSEVRKLACQVAGSVDEMQAMVLDKSVWRAAVRAHDFSVHGLV